MDIYLEGKIYARVAHCFFGTARDIHVWGRFYGRQCTAQTPRVINSMAKAGKVVSIMRAVAKAFRALKGQQALHTIHHLNVSKDRARPSLGD